MAFLFHSAKSITGIKHNTTQQNKNNFSLTQLVSMFGSLYIKLSKAGLTGEKAYISLLMLKFLCVLRPHRKEVKT